MNPSGPTPAAPAAWASASASACALPSTLAGPALTSPSADALAPTLADALPDTPTPSGPAWASTSAWALAWASASALPFAESGPAEISPSALAWALTPALAPAPAWTLPSSSVQVPAWASASPSTPALTLPEPLNGPSSNSARSSHSSPKLTPALTLWPLAGTLPSGSTHPVFHGSGGLVGSLTRTWMKIGHRIMLPIPGGGGGPGGGGIGTLSGSTPCSASTVMISLIRASWSPLIAAPTASSPAMSWL